MGFDIPEASGVYRIRNVNDGTVYVGSAVNLRIRWFHHRKLLRKRTHHCAHLQRAWLKHGESVFLFEVVELCSIEHLLRAEQVLLDQAGGHRYNMAPVAYSQQGRRHTQETKDRISAAMKRREFTASHRAALAEAKRTSEKAREQSRRSIAKASEACRGRVDSIETRTRKSLAHLGKPLSVAHRAAISAGLRRAVS